MPEVEHSHGPHFPAEHREKHHKQLEGNNDKLARLRKEKPGNEGVKEYNRTVNEMNVIRKHLEDKHGE